MTERIENRDGRLNHLVGPFFHMGREDAEEGLPEQSGSILERQANEFMKATFLRSATVTERRFAVQVYQDGFNAYQQERLPVDEPPPDDAPRLGRKPTRQAGPEGFGKLDPGMLDQFTGTERYHRFSPIFRNVVLSDGALYVAENGGEHGAYWLMDAIASQIPLAGKRHPMLRDMQFWELKVNLQKKSAVLTCVPDSDMKPVVTQRIPHTDFDLPYIKFYVQPQATPSGTVWTIFLPSEY